jgi:HK97 gp10 family phage protein
MDSVTFRVDGLDQMIAALGKISKKIEVEVANEVNASALKIQSNAKKNAPINFGTLRQSIQLVSNLKDKRLTYTIGSQLPYAPYVEFGTSGTGKFKGNLKIPSGYEEFAAQFKGKSGGTFRQMVEALMLWVKAQGITGTYSVKTQKRLGSKSKRTSQDKSAAYAIAISILKKGLRAQPYLIPAFEAEKPILRSNIKKVIQNVKS